MQLSFTEKKNIRKKIFLKLRKVNKIQILNRLFHEENPRVFEAQSIKFGCTCSADKVRNTMSMYSSKDIETMTTADGKVTADCQFCGAHYIMEPTKLGFEADKNV